MVEWKKLGEIGDVCMCKRIMKNQTFDKGDVPFYKIGTFGGNADAFISKDLFHEYKSRFSFPQKGEILLSASGTIGRTVVYNGEDAYFQDSNIVWISNDETQVTNAFLYYCYQIVDWKIDGGTIKRLYNYNLKNTIIPIPSLEEQTRIVGILDTFTSAIDNLKEQIAQRRKQYEYYRDQLLDLEGKEGVEMKTLGEICEIKGRIGFRGYTRDDQVAEGEGVISLSPGNIEDGKMVYDGCTYITWTKYEESPEIKTFNGDILFCKTGSTVGKVAMVEHLPYEATINPQLVVLKNVSINAKFLKYTLGTYRIQSEVKRLAGIGSVPNISQEKLGNLEILLPSLSEQQRIVSILDTFEASIQNLEAQLSQREKQYEYYRNILLSFE